MTKDKFFEGVCLARLKLYLFAQNLASRFIIWMFGNP